MSVDDLTQNLIEYIKNGSSRTIAISPSDRLLEDGIIDSQGMLGLIMYIEDTCDIVVANSDVDFERFGSVEAIVRYIVARQAVQG